jgi:hypothetical protein
MSIGGALNDGQAESSAPFSRANPVVRSSDDCADWLEFDVLGKTYPL